MIKKECLVQRYDVNQLIKPDDDEEYTQVFLIFGCLSAGKKVSNPMQNSIYQHKNNGYFERKKDKGKHCQHQRVNTYMNGQKPEAGTLSYCHFRGLQEKISDPVGQQQ